MALFDVGNVHLNIEGDVHNPHDLPWLIFLHGFTLSSQDWLPLFEHFQDEFNPLAIDIIGHGKSDSPDELQLYSMDECVDQIRQVLRELEINQAHWIGYSMGGRVLLTLASQSPAYIASMILESTTPGIRDDTERNKRLERDKQMARFLWRNPIEIFVDRWMAHPIFESQQSLPQEKLAQGRSIRLAQSKTGLANSLAGMGRGAMPHRWDELSGMNMPALLITGELDESHVATHAQMDASLPNSRHIVVEKAGHNIHFERPRKFIEITRQFLRERDK